MSQSLPGAGLPLVASVKSGVKTLADFVAFVEGELSNTTASYAGKGVVRYAW